jgi:hypothetical protein
MHADNGHPSCGCSHALGRLRPTPPSSRPRPPPPPASELPVNRAPLAELAVQITPSRPRTGDLEDPVQRQPVISRPPHPPRPLLNLKQLGERHSSSDIKPQTKAAPEGNSLESAVKRFGNPLCPLRMALEASAPGCYSDGSSLRSIGFHDHF